MLTDAYQKNRALYDDIMKKQMILKLNLNN